MSSAADSTTVGGEVLAERAAKRSALVADVMRNPRFPGPSCRGSRPTSSATSPSSRASRSRSRRRSSAPILYGNHPYGRMFPTERMVRGYTIAQVRAFHAANFGAKRAHLYVAGVFDAAAVEAAVRQAFGELESRHARGARGAAAQGHARAHPGRPSRRAAVHAPASACRSRARRSPTTSRSR